MASQESLQNKVLVFTATYNERDNIGLLLDQIVEHAPDCDILVVDDSSPDGTGHLLDQRASAGGNLTVIHRQAKLGLGSAHKLAMLHAIRTEYDHLVTMDADFSHQPSDIPRLLKAAANADFVIGSRYAKGGSSDLTGYRKHVSQLANLAARILLGPPLREFTTSFRVFRVSSLGLINIGMIRAQGYSFFLETVFRIHRSGATMTEVPIHFAHRLEGESKIPRHEIFNGMSKLLYLFLARLLGTRGENNARLDRTASCTHCGSYYLIERAPRRNVIGNIRIREFFGHNDEIGVRCQQCGGESEIAIR